MPFICNITGKASRATRRQETKRGAEGMGHRGGEWLHPPRVGATRLFQAVSEHVRGAESCRGDGPANDSVWSTLVMHVFTLGAGVAEGSFAPTNCDEKSSSP